jgi:hypothetical protein
VLVEEIPATKFPQKTYKIESRIDPTSLKANIFFSILELSCERFIYAIFTKLRSALLIFFKLGLPLEGDLVLRSDQAA